MLLWKIHFTIYHFSFVAREDAVRYLVEQGVPVGVFDETGLSALALMIEKMPNIAKESLEQFVSIDRAFRKEYYYLNYLEHDPTTWMDLEARKQDKKKRKLAGERRIKHCPTTPIKVCRVAIVTQTYA